MLKAGRARQWARVWGYHVGEMVWNNHCSFMAHLPFAHLSLKEASLGKDTVLLSYRRKQRSEWPVPSRTARGTQHSSQFGLALTCPLSSLSPALPKPFLMHAFQENVYWHLPSAFGGWAVSHLSLPQLLGLFWESECWIRNLKLWSSLRSLRDFSLSALWPPKSWWGILNMKPIALDFMCRKKKILEPVCHPDQNPLHHELCRAWQSLDEPICWWQGKGLWTAVVLSKQILRMFHGNDSTWAPSKWFLAKSQ